MDKVGKKTLEIMKDASFYNRWLFSLIRPYLKGSVLEVGAGIGNFTQYLHENNSVIAIDIDKYYISKLKKIVGLKNRAGYGDIEKGDYFFENLKFDTIICLNVLEHIKDHEIALDNMFQLLRKNGNLILLVPAHNNAYTLMDKNLGHFRRYNKKELEKIIKKAKFEVIKVRYFNFFGLLGWFVNGKIFRRKIIPSLQLSIFDKLFLPWLILEKKLKIPFGLSLLLIASKK